jgi:hypothetical protein
MGPKMLTFKFSILNTTVNNVMLRYTIRSSRRTCSLKKRATSDFKSVQRPHTSASRKDEAQSISETVKAKVQIENEVVSSMDRFMTAIREQICI